MPRRVAESAHLLVNLNRPQALVGIIFTNSFNLPKGPNVSACLQGPEAIHYGSGVVLAQNNFPLWRYEVGADQLLAVGPP